MDQDASFAEAVQQIAAQDLELWHRDHDLFALARAAEAAAQHAEAMMCSNPGDVDPKAWQIDCLKAQAHAARLARLLAHQQVIRTDALLEVLEAEHEASAV
jgi:hypothetical protein